MFDVSADQVIIRQGRVVLHRFGLNWAINKLWINPINTIWMG